MINVEFSITMKCTANCDDRVAEYMGEAIEYIKKGLKIDIRKLGVTVNEIEVKGKVK